MSYPIVCTNCGSTGEVLRVTASLECPNCRTGQFLDLDDKTASQQSHHTWLSNGQWGTKDEDDEDEDNGDDNDWLHDEIHTGSRTAASPGTGWTQTRPDPLANWNEYAGPTPGGNENIGHKTDADDSGVCPICHGTGTDPRASGGGYEEVVCRNCHGTGKSVPPTGQPQTESLDAHKPGPVPLGGGWQGKQSAKVTIDGKTYNASIDINYVANEDKLNKMASAVKKANPGLTDDECRALAGRSLDRYREGRD